MTCVIGLVCEDKVYMGADRAAVAGWDLTVRKDPKLFVNGDFLMGFTTSFRMGQLLRFKFTPPEHKLNMDVYEYMVREFVDKARECLKVGGFTTVNNNEETAGEFLVGYQGHLFCVNSDFQVGMTEDSFMAIGSGAQIALGSLYSTIELPPQERVLKALEAAEHLCVSVRRPFDVRVL